MKRKITAVLLLSFCLICLLVTPVLAVLTVTSASVDDWTAVAAGAHYESTVIDISGSYAVAIQIQAFLDTVTAHEGTEFIIQTSFNTSGDEDWSDLTRFIALDGTANSEAITNNPLAAGEGHSGAPITCADTTGYTMDALPMRWIGIEESPLANSELILQEGFTAATNIVAVDGTTNAHVQNTLMWNIAISRIIVIPAFTGSRARVIANNKYDDDGTSSSLNVRVRKVNTTALN